MSVRGRKPEEDRTQVRHRNPETHEWQEVLDQPYTGDKPELPELATMMSRGGNTYTTPYLAETREWWRVLSSMPHCALWEDSDWQFALTSAPIANQVFMGNASAAAELRMREKIMGTTWDSRRDLRIKYVSELSQSNESTAESNGQVVKPSSNDRRQRLTSVA